MVEYNLSLNLIFASLAHPTRRDILRRLQESELTVNEIAEPYDVSLAAISKHLNSLQRAHLVVKRPRGPARYVAVEPRTIHYALKYMRQYEADWQERFDRLNKLMQEES